MSRESDQGFYRLMFSLILSIKCLKIHVPHRGGCIHLACFFRRSKTPEDKVYYYGRMTSKHNILTSQKLVNWFHVFCIKITKGLMSQQINQSLVLSSAAQGFLKKLILNRTKKSKSPFFLSIITFLMAYNNTSLKVEYVFQQSAEVQTGCITPFLATSLCQ